MRITRVIILTACLGALFSACSGQKESAAISRIVFDRGHGSMWGNQFFIELCPEEIVCVRYFPENSGEQTTREHIPISKTAWEKVLTAVQTLEPQLEADKPSLWQQLWGGQKLDGGEYRNLTIYRQTGTEETQTLYRLPSDPAVQALELLLEGLVEPETAYELTSCIR